MRTLRLACLVALTVAAFVVVAPASSFAATGANFIATGHDMDYHCSAGTTPECEYLTIVVNKVRNGSTLPILAIDQGSELPDALADAGFTGAGEVVTVDPAEASTFNATAFVDSSGHPLYSAIITASDSSCGGCDDTPEGEENINDRAADFATYFNHGGGILALAGAGDYATYYNFVPLTVGATVVSPPFTVTPEGEALGVSSEMANCCATHNSFEIPPSPLVVLEDDDAGKAETIAALNATIGEGGFTTPPAEPAPAPAPAPEPAPVATVLATKTVAPPKKCMSARSVTVHWSTILSGPLSAVQVSLDGKSYKHLAGSARKLHISFAGRSKGAVSVKIIGTALSGGTWVSTRIFHPCEAAIANTAPVVLFLKRK